MIELALRKIEAELHKLADNPDGVDAEAIRTAARRIGAQAEMLEQGLDEPVQVAV